jgi:hypothetical protein
MGEKGSALNNLVRKSERRKPLDRCRYEWEYNCSYFINNVKLTISGKTSTIIF